MSEHYDTWQAWVCFGRRRIEIGWRHFAWLRTDYLIVAAGIERS